MRRREPPCAVAPNLCPAESKFKLNSFRCALERAAAIRLPAVALLATPHAGAIRVLFTRLGPPHGSPVEARCVSRTSRVKKINTFLPVAPPTGVPGTCRGALACARCTFVLRMVVSPQRGAHFPYLRSHEHHLRSAKLSSRLRAAAQNQPIQMSGLYSTSGPSSSFVRKIFTLFPGAQTALPHAALRRCAKPMACPVQMQVELIPLRPAVRRGH